MFLIPSAALSLLAYQFAHLLMLTLDHFDSHLLPSIWRRRLLRLFRLLLGPTTLCHRELSRALSGLGSCLIFLVRLGLCFGLSLRAHALVRRFFLWQGGFWGVIIDDPLRAFPAFVMRHALNDPILLLIFLGRGTLLLWYGLHDSRGGETLRFGGKKVGAIIQKELKPRPDIGFRAEYNHTRGMVVMLEEV